MSTAPSAWQLQQVIAQAQQTLQTLRAEHGQIIETDAELAAALRDEGVSIDRTLQRLVSAAQAARANAAAADTLICDLMVRRARFRANEEACRSTLLQAMEALGLRHWSCPQATLSVTTGRPHVVVTDPDELPDALVTTTVVRTPNKTAILAALLGRGGDEYGATQPVPGACLSNPASVLTVRSK